MYCVELGDLKWIYTTALAAWHNNRALNIRKACPQMRLGDGVITGVKTFEDFVKHLDADEILGYHTLQVYKTEDSEV